MMRYIISTWFCAWTLSTKISWTSFKSSNSIKIINKILLQYYYDPVLNMKFLQGKHHHYMLQNFELFSGNLKEGFDAAEQAVIGLTICTQLKLVKKFVFLTFLSMYSTKSICKLYSVSAKKKMVHIRNTLVYHLWFI